MMKGRQPVCRSPAGEQAPVDDLFDHQTVPEYNTRAVEKLTGIPADTFRAWERRHGLPAPARTTGNHRLYSERDIAIITWLKKMTDQGVSISRAVSMARRKLEDDPAALPPQQLLPVANSSDLLRLQQSLIDAFVGFDSQLASQIMEEALALYDVERVCFELIQPALIELGRLWERGQICVAVEHFGTSFCMRKLSALFNASQPEFGDTTIVASGVEGETHELGLMLVSVILSRSGFRVIYLGVDLPGCELVEAIRSIQPDAIVLSAPTEPSVETLRRAIATLQEADAIAQPALIGYGGYVFEEKPELRDTVDATYLGKDARSAREILQRQLRSRGERLVLARS
jgi:methanogenic corrinoid protein MtbC1